MQFVQNGIFVIFRYFSKKLSKSRRKFLIWRVPNILIFTIKRFKFRKFGSEKLQNKIKFPIDNLDLSNFVKESSKYNP